MNIYASSDKYKSKCVLCDFIVVHPKQNLVWHYVDVHPEYEVFISRPSQDIAQIIRERPPHCLFKKKKYRKDMKIEGYCHFCGVKKMLQKSRWLTHLCSHTGEKLFCCTKCKTKMPDKYCHHKCEKKSTIKDIEGIFEGKEELERQQGWAISGYMCNECNYLQLTESQLVQHIKTQHNGRNVLYEKLVLVEDPSIVGTRGKYTF